MNSIFLKGGRVIDPSSGLDAGLDVLVRDGTIAALGPTDSLDSPLGVPEVAVGGTWVTPGLIDPHVHLRDPGSPQKETIPSGLRAAVAGGFTAVAAMANTDPVNDNPDVTRYVLERARTLRAARLVPVSAVTRSMEGRDVVFVEAMVRAGVRLFSDDGLPIDDPEVLSEAFRAVSSAGCVISLHEEDRTLTDGGALNLGPVSERLGVRGIPVAAETRRLRRDLELAADTGAAVHIAHVSTRESLDLIRTARRRGVFVTCEVTPHHFSIDESAALRFGTNAKMSPPLRNVSDVEAIREAMADGTIDMIASDHAPHDLSSKRTVELSGVFAPDPPADGLTPALAAAFTEAANGIVGLETSLGLALSLVHQKVIGPARMVEMMAPKPAKLLNLAAGSLAVGRPADLTVIDPNLEWTVEPAKFLSKGRNTPFAGMRLRGRALLTIVAGEIVYDGRRKDQP